MLIQLFSNSNIGNNVLISAGTLIKDENIPPFSIVFGQSPNLIIKENRETFIDEYIDNIWRRE